MNLVHSVGYCGENNLVVIGDLIRWDCQTNLGQHNSRPALPLVSVIIVNYNGETMLQKCLASLLSTDYDPIEIIVVDNASVDESVGLVRQFCLLDSRVTIVQNNHNLGFASGNNVGASYAKGEYLVFLNNDTAIEPTWLKELVAVMNNDDSIGAAQSKLLVMSEPTILDSTGAYLTQYGTIYSSGMLEKDRTDFPQQSDIFVAKGAALLVRKSLFLELGEFDPRFFCYHEELDLCWRIWLNGYRVVFVPRSVVYHRVGGTTRRVAFRDALFFYYGHKNYINTLMKNLSLRYFLRYATPYLLLFLGYTLYSNVGTRYAVYYLARAWLWNLISFRTTYCRRIVVQRTIRKLRDSVILPRLTRKIGFMELLGHYVVSGPRILKLID